MAAYLIKSNGINIRITQENDLDFVIESEQNPENVLYIEQWEKERHKKALSNKDILHLIVENAATCESIGYVILAGIESTSHSIEFKRIVICEKGKGFGREALKLIKKTAFGKLNAHRLWLDVKYKNTRARNLYKSEGFIEEGILRQCILYNGSYESLVIMSILKNEYVAA
jgi:diamine N-acetyltransferase